MKWQFRITFHDQIVTVDTDNEDVKEALTEAEVDPSDPDQVHDWLVENGDDFGLIETPELDQAQLDNVPQPRK